MSDVEKLIAKMREVVAKLECKLALAEADNVYLRKENASLWESVHELQDMNARAREDA